jgi:spore cortex formation protein SpoVR/YcgB (stage V sporulation)
VLRHLATLWGYEVTLTEVEAQTDKVLKQHKAGPVK